MYVGKTLFAQIMEFVPWTSFARIVHRYSGNAGARTLSCAEQFRAMAFAQLTWRESLRDIEASLSANATKLYAMGFRSAVRRAPRWPMPTNCATGASGPIWPPC
jgi:hypothetical protein